jgi:hypothetical protein
MTFDYNKWFIMAERNKKSKALALSEDASKWMSIRQAQGAKIDAEPQLVEICWDYGKYSDPYYLHPRMPRWARDSDDRGSQPSKLFYVRHKESDVWVWDESLSEDTRDVLLSRGLTVPWIRDVSAPTKPVRYSRRCPTMCGTQMVNDDSPRVRRLPFLSKEKLRAIVKEEVDRIDLYTADVCRSRGLGDPYAGEREGEFYEMFFYRRRGGMWVAESYLPDALRAALRERITLKRVRRLWMSLCDD